MEPLIFLVLVLAVSVACMTTIPESTTRVGMSSERESRESETARESRTDRTDGGCGGERRR
jgi:hypothetical protein